MGSLDLFQGVEYRRGFVDVECVLMLAVPIGVSMVKSPYTASGSEMSPWLLYDVLVGYIIFEEYI